MADEEGGGGNNDAQLMAEITTRDKEVTSFLAKKQKAQALQICLQNPPLNAKSLDVKEANAAVVEKVLATIQESEIGGLIDTLDLDACDTLMKYVYRCMGKASNCAIMLKIHSSLSEKAGMGSIVRALTERKTV